MATPQPDVSIESLDLRIAAAERQLLARQLDIRQRFNALGRGLHEAVRPQRLLTPMLGAGLAGFVAWWVRRGLAPAARPPRMMVDRKPIGGLAWSELLLLTWPLLPARWRTRASPATISGLVALGLPLIEHLRGKHTRSPPPATAGAVDHARYAGTWFEIARLPTPFEAGCAGPPSTTYTSRGGHGSEIELLNRSPARGGGEHLAHGVGHVLRGSGGAKLRVSLLPQWLRWLPLAWADHWILFVDRDYSVAVVGDPGRHTLWILSRAPQLPVADLQALVALARERGYPVDRLQVATQHQQPAPRPA